MTPTVTPAAMSPRRNAGGIRQPRRSASRRQAQAPITNADTQACMRRKCGPSAATSPAMVQARRLKLSCRSGDIGCGRLVARDRGEAAPALRFAWLRRNFLAGPAQAIRHAAGIRVDDPARKDRQARLERSEE